MTRAVLVVLVVGCKVKEAPPPPPPVVADARGEAPIEIDAEIVLDAAAVRGTIDAGDRASLDPAMASPPCCCSLASTEPEFETRPRLYCLQDLHGVCVAAARCPAPGSVDAQIATWWQEAGGGDPKSHAADAFVVEAIVSPEIFTGQTCGNPYVVDTPSPNDECLRLAIVNHRPPKFREGWECKGFSGTDLAKRIKTERAAAKDRLRCGNRSNAGVFVAIDKAGKVTAFLVNTYASP